MNFWQHLVFGLFVGFGAALFLQLPFSTALLAVTVLGSIAADVDHPKTAIFKVIVSLVVVAVFFIAEQFFGTYLPLLQAVVFSIAAATVVLALIYILKPRHRGITHSLFALILFAIVVLLLTKTVSIALVGGLSYLSHLIADGELKLV